MGSAVHEEVTENSDQRSMKDSGCVDPHQPVFFYVSIDGPEYFLMLVIMNTT